MVAPPGWEVFDLAGLRIHVAEAPPLLAEAVSKAFSLSKRTAAAFDVAMMGAFAEDGVYYAEMPAFIKTCYDALAPGAPPVVINGPEKQLAVLDKGRENSSYAVCAPPYDRFDLIAQKRTDKSTPLIFQTVLIPIISELLLGQDKLLMHAACVASPKGQGLLFLGDSGDGKTTTAFTMVRQGFGLLSDDLVIAWRRPTGIELVPIREHLNLTENTISFFPELSSTLSGRFPAGVQKVPVDPRKVLADERLLDKVAPSAVFILQKRKGGPKLVPAGGKQILDAILKAATFAHSESISSRRVSLIWGLLDQARAFDLITGLDPKGLGRFLAEAAESDFDESRFSPVRSKSRPPCASAVPPTSTAAFNPRLEALRRILPQTLDGIVAPPASDDLLTLTRSDAFLRWARHHRIDPLVMKWIVEQGDIPQNQGYRQAREETVKNAAAAMDMAHWARTVAEQLTAAGISPIIMRGPAMAAKYFPEPQLRHCRDLDFFVRSAELPQAEAVVHRLGFNLQGDRRYWLEKKELRYGNGRIDIELHWDWTAEFGIHSGDGTEFLPETEPVVIDGLALNTLQPTDLMLSCCHHFAFEHKSDRLVRLVDLRQMTKKKEVALDWDRIERQARTAGSQAAVGHTLFLAEALAGAEIPENVFKHLKPETWMEKIGTRLLGPEVFLMNGSRAGLRRSIYGRIVARSRHIGSI